DGILAFARVIFTGGRHVPQVIGVVTQQQQVSPHEIVITGSTVIGRRAARKPLRGGARVARAWVALSPKFAHEPIEIKLNGRLGLVLPSRDGHRAALSFVVSDGRITRVDAIRNPEKLSRLPLP
ncbi:MAG: hypothetical protein QOJ29_4950, partial [Thermoleophilaceae bacterium]|nr:hypothetical protein [Thermoleophilaceae bacterium]